jgi:hypothetical protein
LALVRKRSRAREENGVWWCVVSLGWRGAVLWVIREEKSRGICEVTIMVFNGRLKWP